MGICQLKPQYLEKRTKYRLDIFSYLVSQNIRTYIIKPWVRQGRGCHLLQMHTAFCCKRISAVQTNQVSLVALSPLYLMCHYSDARIIQVEPGGNLPVGDDENVPHPRGVSLYRSQGVTQLLIVLETAGRNILVLLGLQRQKHPFSDFNTAPKS